MELTCNTSDKNILYLHLSHKTNQNFDYEPKIDTPKFVWNYLSASNLLKGTDLVDLESLVVFTGSDAIDVEIFVASV